MAPQCVEKRLSLIRQPFLVQRYKTECKNNEYMLLLTNKKKVVGIWEKTIIWGWILELVPLAGR